MGLNEEPLTLESLAAEVSALCIVVVNGVNNSSSGLRERQLRCLRRLGR